MIPKREKTTDIASEVAQGALFRKRIVSLADEVSNRFVKNGDNLNDVIAEVAKRESFNQLQVQRLVEEANTIAYNKKYSEIKKERDRRISFELAELSKVLEIMGPDAPEKIDNPNWVSGKSGEGNINKEASTIETSYLYNLNSRIDDSRNRLLEKKASAERKQLEKEFKQLQTQIKSDVFKVANSLVMTERLHKVANETFNTMLSDIQLDDGLIEGIQKKACEISERLVSLGRAVPSFNVSLEVNPTEKVANVLLGEYSLIKQAEESIKAKEPKIAPTADVSQYQQLIELAKSIQQNQEQSLKLEKEINLEKEVE